MNFFSRCSPARLRRSLRTREALRINRTVGGVAVPVARAGLSFALPIVALAALGRIDLVPFAMFGAFASMYFRVETGARRLRQLPLIALGLVASLAVTLVVAAATASPLAVVLVLAVIAALAKLASDMLDFGPPGGLMFVFAAGAGANASHGWSSIGLQVGVTAASAALSVALSLLGSLLHPTGPHRVATARALTAVADHLEAPNHTTRHRAHLAVQQASTMLRSRRGKTADKLRAHLAHATSLLQHPGSEATDLRHLIPQLRRGRVPHNPQFQLKSCPPAPRSQPGPRRRRRAAPFLPNAGRIFLACLLAGVVTHTLGLGHEYWAVVSAGAVLQSTHATATWHRTVQRMTGTVAGAALAVVMFAFHPSPVATLALVVVCVLAAELVVMNNYALGLVFVTPVALGLGSLGGHTPEDVLLFERVTTTILGALVGAAVSLLLINRQTTHRLDAALTECRRAQSALYEALTTTVSPTAVADSRSRLMQSLFALRNAHATAEGEPWHRNTRTREVMATEHQAYHLLATSAPAPVERQVNPAFSPLPAPGDRAPGD